MAMHRWSNTAFNEGYNRGWMHGVAIGFLLGAITACGIGALAVYVLAWRSYGV